MSYSVKSKDKSLPGGWRFYQPETRWTARPGSYESIVQQVLAHRRGNTRFPFATDEESVRFEVEQYNVRRCLDHGWLDYLQGQSEPESAPDRSPKAFPRSLLRSVARVAAGGETLVDWIRSKEESVAPELAEERASICAKCVRNSKSKNLLTYFTVPASNAIRRELERRRGWELKTRKDEELGVCTACGCPLELKVHCPFSHIQKHLDEETWKELDAGCWLFKESNPLP